MYDAVHLFAKALHDLDTSQQIDIQPLSCDGQDTWPHGYSLINYMKIVSDVGGEVESWCTLCVAENYYHCHIFLFVTTAKVPV